MQRSVLENILVETVPCSLSMTYVTLRYHQQLIQQPVNLC
jgi:hypothetical protein